MEQKSLCEQLEEYFNTTPKEEIERDWREIEEKYCFGPTVEEFLEAQKQNPHYCEL